MVLRSYAKINLSLLVNKKTKTGFHEIQTLYCLIDLHDKISIKKIKSNKDHINFRGPYSNKVNKSNNSITKLLILLRDLKLIKNYYSINIIKRIPVFAGLGGGSSNAAYVTRYLIKDKINKRLLKILENNLGSDFKLFFYNQGYLMNLNKIISLKKKHKLYFLIIFPNFNCSTKKIYSMFKRYSVKKKISLKNLVSRVKFSNHIIKSKNDLQSVVEKKYPVIRKLLIDINKEKGCHVSRMTGSGSACFGLFFNKNHSKSALKSLKKRYPKFWFSIAKTI